MKFDPWSYIRIEIADGPLGTRRDLRCIQIIMKTEQKLLNPVQAHLIFLSSSLSARIIVKS